MTPAALLGAAVLCAGSPRFAVSEIEPDGDLEEHWTADVDGDGRSDILLGVWSRAGGRELLIHLQAPDGRFPPVPDRRAGIKSDVTAFAVADVREEPGAELLLFTPSACFSYSTLESGYAGNARRLFECSPIFAVPSPKRIPRMEMVEDIDGDRVPEVLVPGAGDCSIYGRAPDGSYGRRAVLRLPLAGDEPKRRERRYEIRVGQGAGFRRIDESPPRLAEPWDGGEDGREGPLLSFERWIPRPLLADVDGDGRKDFLYLDRKDGDLKTHRQGKDGSFADRPDWKGHIGASVGSLTCLDLDGDGRPDLLASDPAGDEETNLRFFLNRGGEIQLDRPSGLLKLSGYGIRPHAADLDGDGKIELAVVSFHLETTELLQGAGVTRSLLIYRSDPAAVFGRRPVSRLDERISAADFKALTQPVNLDADLLGTGGRQALTLDAQGRLIARGFDGSLRLETEPFWRFVPRKAVVGIEALPLDGDGRSDLVLRHVRSLTVLVSR